MNETETIKYKTYEFPKEQLAWLLSESKKTAYSGFGAFFGMISNQCLDSKEDFLQALERVMWQRQDTTDLLNHFDASKPKPEFPTEVKDSTPIKLSPQKLKKQAEVDKEFTPKAFDDKVEL